MGTIIICAEIVLDRFGCGPKRPKGERTRYQTKNGQKAKWSWAETTRNHGTFSMSRILLSFPQSTYLFKKMTSSLGLGVCFSAGIILRLSLFRSSVPPWLSLRPEISNPLTSWERGTGISLNVMRFRDQNLCCIGQDGRVHTLLYLLYFSC